MISAEYQLALEQAFRKLYQCGTKYVETVPVIETWQGKTVWEGDVEVFDLVGHPKAKRGYAWAYDKGKGSEIVAVLELPPVISPKTAVQAAIVSKTKTDARN
jgi:hypothetical protein